MAPAGDWRRLGAAGAVGGAGGEPDPDIVLRDDDGAVLLEAFVAAGVVAVEVRVDHVLDRQRRDCLDRGLDLVVQRRELAVHHDDAVGADRDGDVAALALQPIGLVAEVGCLDLDLVPVDRSCALALAAINIVVAASAASVILVILILPSGLNAFWWVRELAFDRRESAIALGREECQSPQIEVKIFREY